jgi:hypothetical protein
MFRHPCYLGIPWGAARDQKERRMHHHVLLTLFLILVAMFLLGVGVTSGLT